MQGFERKHQMKREKTSKPQRGHEVNDLTQFRQVAQGVSHMLFHCKFGIITIEILNCETFCYYTDPTF